MPEYFQLSKKKVPQLRQVWIRGGVGGEKRKFGIASMLNEIEDQLRRNKSILLFQ